MPPAAEEKRSEESWQTMASNDTHAGRDGIPSFMALERSGNVVPENVYLVVVRHELAHAALGEIEKALTCCRIMRSARLWPKPCCLALVLPFRDALDSLNPFVTSYQSIQSSVHEHTVACFVPPLHTLLPCPPSPCFVLFPAQYLHCCLSSFSKSSLPYSVIP